MLAVLLAAGAGRRLGGPKALLDLAGQSALDRCCCTLLDAGVTQVRVVLGASDGEVRAAHSALPVDFVSCSDWERGQTASLQAGLRAGAIPSTGFLLHTVDHPLVRSEQVRRLLESFATRPPGTKIVVPSVAQRRGHPALFARELADEFLALGVDEAAHRVVRADATRVTHVLFDDPWLIRDLDTPDDLAAAIAALEEI
ncbi:MAG: glycosyl transferase [Planctomycetota bacterium]|nr:MAG: glycosyl transferase [Planctomycetota bacterium]